MLRPRVPTPPVPSGFGFPLGFLAAILATTIAVAAGATVHPELSLILLATETGTIAALSTPAATAATAAVSWALHAGFVLGRHGDLALTQPSTRDALILGAVALAATVLTALVRTLRNRAHSTTVPIPAPRSAVGPAARARAH